MAGCPEAIYTGVDTTSGSVSCCHPLCQESCRSHIVTGTRSADLTNLRGPEKRDVGCIRQHRWFRPATEARLSALPRRTPSAPIADSTLFFVTYGPLTLSLTSRAGLRRPMPPCADPLRWIHSWYAKIKTATRWTSRLPETTRREDGWDRIPSLEESACAAHPDACDSNIPRGVRDIKRRETKKRTFENRHDHSVITTMGAITQFRPFRTIWKPRRWTQHAFAWIE